MDIPKGRCSSKKDFVHYVYYNSRLHTLPLRMIVKMLRLEHIANSKVANLDDWSTYGFTPDTNKMLAKITAIEFDRGHNPRQYLAAGMSYTVLLSLEIDISNIVIIVAGTTSKMPKTYPELDPSPFIGRLNSLSCKYTC